MSKADQYAQWIIDNADKKGTEEFNIVAQAYQEAKGMAIEPVDNVKPDTGFTGAFSAGKERLKGDIALLAGKTGLMSLEDAERYKREKDALAQRMFKPTEEGWSQAPLLKFRETLGGSLPYMAAPLVAGVGAKAIGVGAGVGLAGAGLASLGQFTGSNLARQMETGKTLEETSLGKAAAAAAPQTALDLVSLRMIPVVGKLFGAAGKEVTPELAKKIAEQGMLRTTAAYGAGSAKLAGIEGATEVGQQFLERLQAGLNISDQQARDEYFDSFIGGAVLGGTLAVPGTYLERGAIVRQGSQMEQEQKRQAMLDRQRAEQEAQQKAALEQRQQIQETRQQLGVPETLALPAPDKKYVEPSEDDPLFNPLGRFKTTDLSAKEIAEINQRRQAMGKSRIGKTFSIEDLADVFTPEESKTAEGVLGRLVASRTGFQAGNDVSPDILNSAAQERGIATDTQGFRDFLERTTGTNNLEDMSPPQRLAVARALRDLPKGAEPQVLQAGITTVKHYTPEQYTKTIGGINKEFAEVGDKPNGRESVLKQIEKYSGLTRRKDQQRLLDQALLSGDLERVIEVRNVNGVEKNVEMIQKPTPRKELPAGMDIRKETFKQGDAPDLYEIRSGSRVINQKETAEEAEEELVIHERNRQAKIVDLEKQINSLQAGIQQREDALLKARSLGEDTEDQFFIDSAKAYDKDQEANQKIATLRQQQQKLTQPVRIVPVGTRALTQNKFTYYEKGKPTVKFDREEQAEAYGISRLNDQTLQQIIDSAPAQKQTGRVKRYVDLAQKELDSRTGKKPEGIEITTKQGLEGAEERLEKLGLVKKEAQEKLIANIDAFRKSLLPTLKRFGLEKIGLNIVESIENGKADGSYVKNLITLALDAKDVMGTLRHESIHALKELGGFTDAEWRVLTNKAKTEWVQKFITDRGLFKRYQDQYKQDYGNLKGFDEYIQEEAIAEAFRFYSKNKLPAGMIGNIIIRLQKFFEALRNSFNKLGFTTANDIFNKIEEGGIKTLEPVKAEAEKKLSFKPEETEIANKTSRSAGAVSAQAIVPRYVEQNAKKDESILDFGAGKDAVHAARLRSQGLDVTAHEFGSNQRKGIHDFDALNKKYDHVYASNVLNVQSSKEMLGKTLDQMTSVLGKNGKLTANFPSSPRKSADITPQVIKEELQKRFKNVERVGGTSSAPLFHATNLKYSLKETEQFPKDAVENNNWKATPVAKRMAEDYAKENDFTPYISEGQLSIPVEPVKYSIKPPSDDPTKNDPTTGLPLNKNGSVTLYYPTTADEVRRINNEKKITPSNPNMSAIYLTNESSGWKSFGTEPIPFAGMVQYSRISDEYQVTDGSVVRVEIDPNLLQIAQEYEDGRKEFYVPVKEGEYFNKKMRMWAMYAERNKAIPLATKYSELGNAFERSLSAFKELNEAEKKARTKEVKTILKREHNIGKLLGENGKLEKTRVGDYGITYDDKSVASLGLGLASAQKLNDKTSTCPVSAICEGLCLGDTAGNNKMYGGMASGELAEDIEKTSFRAGPRLSQYLKTEAMMVHPEEFALLLDKEIKAFKRWADKNEYLPAIRLNVTSDIPPKYFKPIMDANPDVIFYDYTKLDSSSVADNHHLTYSSTGVSQIVDGEQVINKEQNWDRMKRLLDKGSNVAMAFTSKTDMPSVIVDEVSGKEYQVWNGDNYDARFLDPKREDGVGMIVGLTNKDSTVKAVDAAKKTKGFFVNYDKNRDGDRVVIQNQSKFAGSKVIPIAKLTQETEENKKFSLALGNVDPTTFLVSEKNPNNTGNLAFMPGSAPFAKYPIRLPVGTHDDINDQGYGANHILRRMQTDVKRRPAEITKERLEDLILHIEDLGKRFKRVYRSGPQLVLYDPLTDDAMFVRQLADHYEVQSMYSDARIPTKYGNAAWSGKNIQPPEAKKFEEKQRGILVQASKEGRVEPKPIGVRIKRVLTPNQIEAEAEKKPTKGTLSLKKKMSLKAPDTPEVDAFMNRKEGKSKIVNEDGTPKIMYHGTARDITEFMPKQASAIFFTSNPKFANDFTYMSEDYMNRELFNDLTTDEKEQIQLQALENVKDELSNSDYKKIKSEISLFKGSSYGFIDNEILFAVNKLLGEKLPSRRNIIPVYIYAQNPFDYQNEDHLETVYAKLDDFGTNSEGLPFSEVYYRDGLSNGNWNAIEDGRVQQVIKDLGFDGFYVSEGGNKNLAVYDSSQIKSAFNVTPTKESKDIRFSFNVAPESHTKLEQVNTYGKTLTDTITSVFKMFKDPEERIKTRIAFIDPNSGLARSLQDQEIYKNGILRGDLLARAKAQTINLIRNGLQTGIPVVNSDGSVIIEIDEVNNLANSRIMADRLNDNYYVKGSELSGRAFVAEVARALRGKEIMEEDRIHNAKTGENRNREKQVTQAQIDWAEKQLKNVPEMQEIFDIWKKVNTGLINLWESVGLFSKAEADTYRAKKFYVSLAASNTDLETMMESQLGFTAAGLKSTPKVQKLEGAEYLRDKSGKVVLDENGNPVPLKRNIWENIDKQYASMLAGAYQNQVRKVAVTQLIDAGAARIPTKKRNGVDVGNPDAEGINLRYKDPTNPFADSKGVVHVIVDNATDLSAFESMHYELGPVLKFFGGATNILRAGALLNPMFWIRQLIRDPIHASIVANGGIVTPFHSAKEYINILRKDSEEAKILASRGVIGQYDSTLDLQTFLNQVGTEKVDPSNLEKVFHKLMLMHEASDAATRVAIFKKEKQSALDKGMTEEEAVNYGVMKSREAINFLVHGNSKTLNAARQMIPFLSASITSLDTVYRAATGYNLPASEKEAAKKLFKQRAALMFGASVAYAMLMQDDEEYQKQPNYVKDNNWLIKNPLSDGFIKVPVPYEVGFLFKVVPEVAIRYAYGNDTGKEMIKAYKDGLLHNLPTGGVPVPQAIKPALENFVNYSFFTGNPVESIGDARLPVEARGRNASETAKFLSGAGLGFVGLSPAKIDNLVQGYFAEAGTFMFTLADELVYTLQGKDGAARNLEKQPFFKAFMTDPNADKAVANFFDIQQTANRTAQGFNELKNSGRLEEAREMVEDEEKKMLIASAPTLRKFSENMTKVRRQIEIVKNDQSRTPEERRELVNKLTAQYNIIAQQGVKAANTLGIR